MLIIIVNGRTNAKSKNTTRLKQSLMRLGVFGGVCSSLVLAEQNKKAHCVQASIEIFNENQLRGVSIEKNWISQTMVQRLGEARQHIHQYCSFELVHKGRLRGHTDRLHFLQRIAISGRAGGFHPDTRKSTSAPSVRRGPAAKPTSSGTRGPGAPSECA